MLKTLVTVFLLLLGIQAVLPAVGVVTGFLLRLLFTDLDLGLGSVAGVVGAGFSGYLVYRLLSGALLIEEVEEGPVLESMADSPRYLEYLEQRGQQPKARKPRQKHKPPSPSS